MNPHGDMPPDSHGGGRFKVPQDGAMKEPSLPVGTLEVYVLDAFQEPMANQTVELKIIHSTIAQGETRESASATTDEKGRAVFTDLMVGSGHSYNVRVEYQEASFTVRDVRLDDRSGSVALLHLFETTTDIFKARLISASEVRIGQKDDVLVISYRIEMENPGPYALKLGEQLVLPKGHKALTVPDNMFPTITGNDKGVMIEGTVRPGPHVIGFTFHVPMEYDGAQELDLSYLPTTVAARVRVTASKKMELKVEGFEPAARRYDGQASWLESSRELENLDQGFITKSHIDIKGLPKRAWGAFVAAGLAFMAVVAGLSYALTRHRQREIPLDTLQDLTEAKQALLAEFVALEKAHRRGEIGPKSYAKIRQAMLESLARIVDKLEKAKAQEVLGR